jgi:hypothetical protein
MKLKRITNEPRIEVTNAAEADDPVMAFIS